MSAVSFQSLHLHHIVRPQRIHKTILLQLMGLAAPFAKMNNYPLRSKKRAEGHVWDLTASDDDIPARHSKKKSRRCNSKLPKRRTDDGANTAIQPELVKSSDGKDNPSEVSIDEEDFEKLRQRYLLPRIQLRSELPSGITLRRTCKPRLIDLKTPGFQRLRIRIDELTKKNDRLEVYRLLCQVRNYEIDPSRVPTVMQEQNQDGDVNEVFDLTQDNDDCDGKECFNVDDYITDVLLPRDETDSRPDCVLSASSSNGKVENSAILPLNRECRKEDQPEPMNVTDEGDDIEARETPLAPKTAHLATQITPEKPLDMSSVAIVTQSASTSRSFTSSIDWQTSAKRPGKSIKKSLHYGLGDQQYQVESVRKHLQMVLPRNKFVEHAYRMKGRNKALAKRAPIVERDMLFGTTLCKMTRQQNICVLNVSMKPPPRLFASPNQPSQQLSLAKEWRSQTRRRKKGEWIPNGHITGRWKQPTWAKIDNDGDSSLSKNSPKKKASNCKKSLLPTLHSIVSDYYKAVASSVTVKKPFKSLQHLSCPTYFNPTYDLLHNAHRAVSSLLPDGDCEEFDVIKLARSYYDYWRPDEVKVILLAESHAHTEKDRALNGPKFDDTLLKNIYDGPCDFISLVYCLAYGENESLIPALKDKNNKGTTQFWTLFAAIARGVDHIAPCRTKKEFASPFAADVLKGGGLSVAERLRAKVKILQDLKRRGIWLLDVSIFGWYISQPQQYTRSSISNEVHRLQKARPPLGLKSPSLVLSWELYTKHLIRQVAKEGHLKLLVPIGVEVELAITRERMNEAISVCDGAEVTDTMPAPNAWIPGGYGKFHAKLAELVGKAAPMEFRL